MQPWKRGLFITCAVLMLSGFTANVSLAQNVQDSKYTVVFFDVKFNQISPIYLEKEPLAYLNGDISGYGLTFMLGAENVKIDLDNNAVEVTSSSSHYIASLRGHISTLPIVAGNPAKLRFNLIGFHTVLVSERLEAGQVRNYWYREVFDEDIDEVRYWEVATIRVWK